MKNCLPFTDEVMVVLVHKYVQQTLPMALHLETLGYIPRLLNALYGLVYFLIIGDLRLDNLIVGSIFRKVLLIFECLSIFLDLRKIKVCAKNRINIRLRSEVERVSYFDSDGLHTVFQYVCQKHTLI